MTDNYGPAHWAAAPLGNYGTGRAGAIDMVIIHDTEGSYISAIDRFLDPSQGVSAHYTFRSSDGDVTQCVHEADTGYHAGNLRYNQRSIGIEHEGFAAHPQQWYTDTMLQASAQLVADICRRYGIPVDRQHIIGHAEVPSEDGTHFGGNDYHTDPGAGWPWDRYMQMVNGTPEIVPLVTYPDYAVYSNPTINLAIFSNVLRNMGSPAYDEVQDCYNTCTDNGVNPAVALAFFALESNYGTAAGAVDRKNWGNLIDSSMGQLATYDLWALGLRDWCNHFRLPAYNNAQTISTIVPIYQPSSAGGTMQGDNSYIQQLHDLVKGWADQLAATPNVFTPH